MYVTKINFCMTRKKCNCQFYVSERKYIIEEILTIKDKTSFYLKGLIISFHSNIHILCKEKNQLES